MTRILGILAVVFVLFGLTGCGYNQMQTNEEAVKAAWGNVDAALQRRLDLIELEAICQALGISLQRFVERFLFREDQDVRECGDRPRGRP